MGGADLNVLNYCGASIFENCVSSDDSNVDVLRYLLSKAMKYGVNFKRKAQTRKWKLVYGIARGLVRLKMMTSGLAAELASWSGATPLQWAALRGDLEVVELLIDNGAVLSVKNDLGKDILSYCKSFPEIKQAIKRIKREMVRTHQNNDKKSPKVSTAGTSSSSSFTLQRRLSTATDIKYNMYLMNVSTMMKVFGTSLDRKKNFHLCHQDLLKKDMLTRFEDLPMGSFVIFVSHQWNGFNHPDPNGRQMQVLSKVRYRSFSLFLSTHTHTHTYSNSTLISKYRYFVT